MLYSSCLHQISPSYIENSMFYFNHFSLVSFSATISFINFLRFSLETFCICDFISFRLINSPVFYGWFSWFSFMLGTLIKYLSIFILKYWLQRYSSLSWLSSWSLKSFFSKRDLTEFFLYLSSPIFYFSYDELDISQSFPFNNLYRRNRRTIYSGK